MPDQYDQATEFEQLRRDIAIAQRKTVILATGFCFNCSQVCPGCFCSSDCRDDFEKSEAARVRNGSR